MPTNCSFRWWAILLVCLLVLTPVRATAQPAAAVQLAAIPTGAPVSVKLKSKEKLRGRLDGLTADTFEMQIATGNSITTRTIPIADLQSIKRTDQTHPVRIVLTTLGVLYGIGAAIGLALGE